MKVDAPEVSDDARQAADALIRLLAISEEEGRAAIEKVCAAARAWAAAASKR